LQWTRHFSMTIGPVSRLHSYTSRKRQD
jgi:hypothetical protein